MAFTIPGIMKFVICTPSMKQKSRLKKIQLLAPCRLKSLMGLTIRRTLRILSFKLMLAITFDRAVNLCYNGYYLPGSRWPGPELVILNICSLLVCYS